MSTDGPKMQVVGKSVAQARRELLRREFLAMDVPTGHGLSYPVPRRSCFGVVTAHFIYGAPATPASQGQTVSRPRYWLLTPPRDARILFFADCQVSDFTSDGYREQVWPRPEPAASSIDDLRSLEEDLLDALESFVDDTFADPASLTDEARGSVGPYVELIQRMTPEPLVEFLHFISPEFWEWTTTITNTE